MSQKKRVGVAPDILARVRLVCLDLPGAVEEAAWTGVRWCVARKNFAHVLNIVDGWPPAYATGRGNTGPCLRVDLPAAPPRPAKATRFRRAPFFRPVWFPNIAGVQIDAATDWDRAR